MAYSWTTKCKRLTADMRKRGVVFASQLYVVHGEVYGIDNSIVHEVFRTEPEPERSEHIARLKDVRFFKGLAREGGYAVIDRRWS